MLCDMNKNEVAGDLRTGVCIVGAGVAGQTLAMRLAGQADVTL